MLSHCVVNTLTSLSHMCGRVCSQNVTHHWFPVMLVDSWQVRHVRKEMFTLSGTPDFTPHEEFMILPIHYIYTLPNVISL